jgi:hypothetical protein
MVLHPLSISGPRDERVNLAFFADGCELWDTPKQTQN